MKNKDLGIIALTMALSSNSPADISYTSAHNTLSDLNEIKILTNELIQSQDEAEYARRINHIQAILSKMTSVEVKKLRSGAVRCASVEKTANK